MPAGAMRLLLQVGTVAAIPAMHGIRDGCRLRRTALLC